MTQSESRARAFVWLPFVCSATLLLAACSARTPENLSNVPIGTESGGAKVAGGENAPTQQTQSAAAQTGERYDPQTEEDVARESLKAWRVAVAHAKKPPEQSDDDWKKQRASDEKSAMDTLNAASKQYPHSSTLYFMMGQVEEHFGKHKEATELYSRSRQKNTINPLTLFKLAENERLLGKTHDAEQHYRELLKAEPGFYAGKLGLAQCLQKEDPAQSRQLAQEVIDAKPDDPAALKAAQAIVSETKGGKSSR